MSGEYVNKLKRRAMNLLRASEAIDDVDLAMFFVDQGIQLYVKAVHYEIFGVRIRGHGIRELLGLLSKELETHGFINEARLIRDFVTSNRDVLVMLEEAYIEARYGDMSYGTDDLSKAINVARELVKLVDGVVRSVKLG
ncbi:MAG: DNA-binding protein [Vulcanisaeta sp. OSP_8]|nr:MAG: DNA-binding protein [Vulcanisaeta sp. OSP_8]